MSEAKANLVGQRASRRRLSTKQKAASLFHLWHSIQDIKVEAEAMQDDELLLLIGMVELLVEERTAGLAGPASGKPTVGRTRRNGVASHHGMA
jgi:hypothetical protein